MDNLLFDSNWYHFIVLACYVNASKCSILEKVRIMQALGEFDSLFVLPVASSTELHHTIEELETSKQSFSRLLSLIAPLDDVRSQFCSFRILEGDRRRKVSWRFTLKPLCDCQLQFTLRDSCKAPWISKACLVNL